MTDPSVSPIPSAAEFTKAHQEAKEAAYHNAYHKECTDMFVKFRTALELATQSNTTTNEPFEFRYTSYCFNTLTQCSQMDRVRAAGYHVDMKSTYYYPEDTRWYKYIIAVPSPTVVDNSTTTFSQQMCSKIAAYFRR